MLEQEIRQIMADETTRLRAAPGLAERVIRSSRRRSARRIRITAVVATAAVAGIAASAQLALSPAPAPHDQVATYGTPEPDTGDRDAPQPLFTEPPMPTPTPTATPRVFRTPVDIGTGNTLGRVQVGYMTGGLVRNAWAVNRGDEYSTSWSYPNDGEGSYRVQIFVYEGLAAARIGEQWQSYRVANDGEQVPLGDGRTGYIVNRWVGEDGGKGTPSIFLQVGEERAVEVMISPDYAKDLGGRRAVERELTAVAAGLTSDD
ncbi:hypothetical protein [Streptosporangium sp. CA-115845]|uniref:hypothetical protein n=1 Tax=Streptosporangium sp. CA-115845 TaxID=3240071 RepID=UPI003D8F034F